MADLLQKVKKRLKELNVPYEYVALSEKPDKKIMVRINGKTIHFGQKGSVTHLESPDQKKRDAYRARSSKIKNKQGQYTYLIKYTPNFLAWNILWP